MIAELSAIQAATGSLKSATDIVSALVSLGIKAEVREKVLELQGIIFAAQRDALSAQASQMELLKRVTDLEGELTRFEDWETEKERYALAQTSMAGVVYMLKQSAVDAGEPPHALCPGCFQKRKKGYLQPVLGQQRNSGFACTECDTIYKMWELPDPVA